jgi:hypothetical protein
MIWMARAPQIASGVARCLQSLDSDLTNLVAGNIWI